MKTGLNFIDKYNPGCKAVSQYNGRPKFFDHQTKRYVNLSDAIEVDRSHGRKNEGEFIDLVSDIGATTVILKKDDAWYLVVKNYSHSGLQMTTAEDGSAVRVCSTLDEADYYAKLQQKYWIK